MGRFFLACVLIVGLAMQTSAAGEKRNGGRPPPPAGSGPDHDRALFLPPLHDPLWKGLGLSDEQRRRLDAVFATHEEVFQQDARPRRDSAPDDGAAREEDEPPPMRNHPFPPKDGSPRRGRRGHPPGGGRRYSRRRELTREVDAVLDEEQRAKLREALRRSPPPKGQENPGNATDDGKRNDR